MIALSDYEIEKEVNNACASVEIEGYAIDEQCKAWCKQLLKKEITFGEYVSLVKEKSGVHA